MRTKRLDARIQSGLGESAKENAMLVFFFPPHAVLPGPGGRGQPEMRGDARSTWLRLGHSGDGCLLAEAAV